MIPFEYRIGKEGDPFDYVNGKGGYLKTIVLNEEKMEAQWKVLNPILIDEFEPKFKLPQGKAVGGIADGKIYIISEEYKVYESWSQLNKIAWDEVLNMSKCFEDKKPRYMFQYFDKLDRLYKFNDWQNMSRRDY